MTLEMEDQFAEPLTSLSLQSRREDPGCADGAEA